MRRNDRNIVLEFRSSQKVINDRSRKVFAKFCPVQEIILITIKIIIFELRLRLSAFIQNSRFSSVGINEGQAKTFLRQITGQQLWLTEINS